METEAGTVDFTNIVRLTKDKQKGYLINWSSSLIFPQLNSTDKVRIKKSKYGDVETVDVGNINFIVHGLDYENQMVNFDAFAEIVHALGGVDIEIRSDEAYYINYLGNKIDVRSVGISASADSVTFSSDTSSSASLLSSYK